jgi:hypothetical protein
VENLVNPVLQGGSIQLALWAGLFGTALLLLVGLLRRRAAGRAPRDRRPREAEFAPALAAEQQRLRVISAYAAQGASPAAIPPSSGPASLPIIPAPTPGSPSCPAELSRRIDRLEAKVRARRAGSHG